MGTDHGGAGLLAEDGCATLVAATKNANKITEIQTMMGSFGFRAIGRGEAGIPDFDVEETGATFEENALIKAEAIYGYANAAVIADDSGLEVDALGGAPGIYSARFSGSESHGKGIDEANNEKLLALLSDVPDEKRTARFVSCIAMIVPGRDRPLAVRGTCPGHIARRPMGANGFGYDSVFIADINAASGRTFAQLAPREKNAVSHRSQALAKLAAILQKEGSERQ